MPEHRVKNPEAAQKAALKRRLLAFYAACNAQQWDRCFSFVDPKLRQEGRVDETKYTASLAHFLDHYGPIRPDFIKATV
jgi:hypothetical protein